MRARGPLTFLLLGSLVLAGCAGPETAEPVSKPLATSVAAAPKTTLLRVLVITDEYLPIKSAKVSVVGLGLNATTDEVGNAYFQIGTPGRYAVHVHRPGFYPNISKVTIEGDPKQVERVTLRDAPRDTHFSDFRYFEGVCEMTVYVQPLSTSPHCQEQGLVQRDHPRGWFLGTGLVSGFLRLDWQAQAYGSEEMRLEIAFPEAGAFANGQERLIAQGPAPVTIPLTLDLLTPAMQRNGLPIEIYIGLSDEQPAAVNGYQTFVLEAQFDYYQEAPDVDSH